VVLHPEVSQEKYLWLDTEGARADCTRTGLSERGSCGGEKLDVRPYARAVVDSTEVFGFWGGGVYQWQECHCDSAQFIDRAKTFVGQNFWAREYYVSTVGRYEAQIREEIIEKQKKDKRLDQLNMFK
jgi:hypothetical protein